MSLRAGLKGYRTLIAGIVGMVAITILALNGEGSTDGAIAQIAGIIGVLAGRSMADRDSDKPTDKNSVS